MKVYYYKGLIYFVEFSPSYYSGEYLTVCDMMGIFASYHKSEKILKRKCGKELIYRKG